jgi:hypothetical protein
MRYRRDGLFFELYESTGGHPHLAPAKKFPLTIFDFPGIRGLKSPPTAEQGAVSFSVHGHDYRAILWLGSLVPKESLVTIDNIVGSIGITPSQPHAPKHSHKRRHKSH